MSALALRVVSAALVLGAIVSCDAPRSPLDEIAPTASRAGLDALDVEILDPRQPSRTVRIDVPGDGFTIRWRPVAVPGRPEVVGYQVKAIDAAHDTAPTETIVSYLTDREDPFEWSDLRRVNHLIPDRLVMEKPDSPDDPYPPLGGTHLYFETQWWPHLDRPLTTPSFVVDQLDPGRYDFAVRAVHADGSVTSINAYAFGTREALGNLLRMRVRSPQAIPHLELRINEDPPVVFTESTRSLLEHPRPLPLRLSWRVRVDYGRGEGPSRFRIDCGTCPPGEGINEWSDWGHWSTPVELTFPPEEAGQTVAITIQAQDDRQDPDHQIEVGFDVDLMEAPLDRTALLIDDFKVSGFTDCEHDAFVIPLVEQAVAAHLEPGETLDRWDAHPPVGPCQESSVPEPALLSRLLRYRTIYWVVAPTGSGSAMGLATDPFSEYGRYLRIYVRLGGNLVVWGRHTIGALLGDYFPPAPYTPELNQWKEPNFGPGTFVYDVMRLRHQFDRSGRGSIPELSLACSGMIGFERTAHGAALGLPAGIPDPTGVLDRTGLWSTRHEGVDNPFGHLVVAPTAGQVWNDPSVRPLYTMIANAATWTDPTGACGEAGGSPFHEQPVVVAIEPSGVSGKIVWVGASLYHVDRSNGDLDALMRGLTDWVFAE